MTADFLLLLLLLVVVLPLSRRRRLIERSYNDPHTHAGII